MSLSRKAQQRCWREEVPMVDISRLIDRRRRSICEGYLERKGELIDYVLYLRTGLLWLRYHGDARFFQGWSSCTFRLVKKKQYALCPFCWSSVSALYIWSQSLRCNGCFEVASRYKQQQIQTKKERGSISRGNLGDIASKLQSSSLSQQYRAIIAMEMAGLTERKYTIGRETAEWKITRSARPTHQII